MHVGSTPALEATHFWFTAICRFPFYFCNKERHLMWDIMTPLPHSWGILKQMYSKCSRFLTQFLCINIQHKFHLHPVGLTVIKLTECFLLFFLWPTFYYIWVILHWSHRSGQTYITYDWLTDNCRRKDRKKEYKKMKRKKNYKQNRRNIQFIHPHSPTHPSCRIEIHKNMTVDNLYPDSSS